MRKHILIILALLAVSAAAAAALPQAKIDVTGSWELTFETPMGTRVYATAFVQDGEAVKVVMKTQQGTELKSDGKIKANEIAWTVVVTGPMGEIPLTFKGKVDGETIAGTVQISDMGDAEFKAKKLKAS
jgi:hypothetical protein